MRAASHRQLKPIGCDGDDVQRALQVTCVKLNSRFKKKQAPSWRLVSSSTVGWTGVEDMAIFEVGC